jgi:hypothetical protein
MTHKVYVAAAVAANTPWTLTVPGQVIWRVLSVVAVLSRAVGGTPTRALRLVVTDGTNTVMASPAADTGTEPGTLTVTWTNAQPAAVASAGIGVTLGPLPVITVRPGYVFTGTVVNGAVADQWTSAVVWVDESAT